MRTLLSNEFNLEFNLGFNLSTLLLLCAFGLASSVTWADTKKSYGDNLANLPQSISSVLAQQSWPNKNGAIGRNRNGYFHVRFQLGVHRIADLALCNRDVKAVETFLQSVEYSLLHQNTDGSFELTIPVALGIVKQAKITDEVSGVAFFISSAGSGLLALETSTWAQTTLNFEVMARLKSIKEQLRATSGYLLKHSQTLELADKTAPNRLLFDALAFLSLGELLDDEKARVQAYRFAKLAIAQTHTDGYFVEAGGYDSSYNGVAAALAMRLNLMDNKIGIADAAEAALNWQTSRISSQGRILSQGNTRVKSDGEKFLGRRKDIDVGQTIEALSLSTLQDASGARLDMAEKIYKYYRRARRRP